MTLRELFKQITDADGNITSEKLLQFSKDMGMEIPDEQILEMIKAVEQDVKGEDPFKGLIGMIQRYNQEFPMLASDGDVNEAPWAQPPPVAGRPTKVLFSMMEEEAGGSTPEPSNLTNFTQEFVYKEVNPKNFYSSNFPSLIAHLGPKATHNTQRNVIKKKKNPTASEDNSRLHTKQHKENATHGAQTRKNNEAYWTRIEAVAQEKIDFYDKYMSDMTVKLKQQRTLINQRTVQLLQALERQEQTKKEEKIFASPYGRIWRHHRSMQRRAFSLEPMSEKSKPMREPTMSYSIKSSKNSYLS